MKQYIFIWQFPFYLFEISNCVKLSVIYSKHKNCTVESEFLNRAFSSGKFGKVTAWGKNRSIHTHKKKKEKRCYSRARLFFVSLRKSNFFWVTVLRYDASGDSGVQGTSTHLPTLSIIMIFSLGQYEWSTAKA